MRAFDNFPKDSICGTNEDKPCTLVGIAGTENGGNMQAVIIHVDCIDLTIEYGDNNRSLMYQAFTKKENKNE